MCPARFSTGLCLPCKQAGLHNSPLGLYSFLRLPLNNNVVEKGKVKKNAGIEKQSADWSSSPGRQGGEILSKSLPHSGPPLFPARNERAAGLLELAVL